MRSYDWIWQTGPELDPAGLYTLLSLREAVFVVEQQCAYQELDGRDLAASTHHLQVLAANQLAATLRLLVPDPVDQPASIGRVVIHPAHRGGGLGHDLMRAALTRIESLWPGRSARLSAQAHLQAYYGRHGFEPIGDIYVEDGIPHIDMQRTRDTQGK
ncbi:GNAT family N-acetyltransferase [Salinicola acroporae]|uniref:GNAT family N-acetyltransferase n=1 Tax=Salinicola acroporae TaxID=1541440 RepID=A0ABT6I0Y5_9GAMM|nr:GNAT family N-acetyltransferase [Salinicola acroporae]MDH4571343.1 GNAT family N-acetyltransferase [Salinicola acroporae]